MNSYKALNKQVFSNGEYSIVPIRMEDRFKIMEWRNEQIYHLRQNKPLTTEDQNNYFKTVISALLREQPDQILFSYLQGDECIGYGGLVHINWIDKNAEISFIMKTDLEEKFFDFHWKNFLSLIEETAFSVLNLHKIYVYAFDLRPHLYRALVSNGFFKDAVLEDHCYFDDRFVDVVIHFKLNKQQ